MLILPAIDIRDGKCVRLYQGDYNQMTVFSDDPVAVGRNFREAGAQFLHLVDLDGAKAGRPVNLDVIEKIMQGSGLPVELGGGVRDEAIVADLLGRGISRVILGTVAIKNPDLTVRLCAQWGERVVIGIDARDGMVAVEGWTETSAVPATALARQLASQGATRFIYTDIGRDGTLTEPNYAALSEFMAAADRPVIASGGVSRPEHVHRLRELGAEGVIIGRALYTGDIKLGEIF